ALVFTGNGRLLAFSSSAYGQLFPDVPPTSVINQLRIAGGYSAAEVDEVPEDEGANPDSSIHLHLRVVVPITVHERFSSSLGVSADMRWLQVIEPVPEQIARNANQVQQGFRDYQELALSRLGLRKLYGIT